MNPPRPLDGTNNTVVLKSFVQLFEGTSSLLLEDFKLNATGMLTRWFITREIDVCLSEEGVLITLLSFNPRPQIKEHLQLSTFPHQTYSFPLAYNSAISSPATSAFTSNTFPLPPLGLLQ